MSDDKAVPCYGLSPGTAVCLHGLADAAYNYHIGTISTHQPDSGRLGVRLGGFLSEASAGQCITDSCDDFRQMPRTEFPCIAVKPERLSRVLLPGQRDAREELTVLGCLSPTSFLHLLGERGRGLPDYLATKVIDWLKIQYCDRQALNVLRASSSRGDFPLQEVLSTNSDTWWISNSGTFQDGIGSEYLEFEVSKTMPVRVSFFSIKIPKMPAGPLSVRTFHILALNRDMNPDVDTSWARITPDLTTLDVSHMQSFLLRPPAETTRLRVICTRNAAGARVAFADCVGLFKANFC